jgi:hypothetical protein
VNSPWHLYKWSIIFFQLTFTLSLEITIIFWTLLFPVMFNDYRAKRGDFASMTDSQALAAMIIIGLDHIAPVTLHIIDWSCNMIKFDLRHYFPAFIVYIAYAVFNAILTRRHGEAYYWTNDWIDHVVLASLMSIFVLALEIAVFLTLYMLTKAKLRSYNAKQSKLDSEQTHQIKENAKELESCQISTDLAQKQHHGLLDRTNTIN